MYKQKEDKTIIGYIVCNIKERVKSTRDKRF